MIGVLVQRVCLVMAYTMYMYSVPVGVCGVDHVCVCCVAGS